MKVFFLIALSTLSGVLQANSLAGQELNKIEVSLHVKNVSLKEALRQLEKSSDIRFTYKSEDVSAIKNISRQDYNRKLDEVLSDLLKNTGLGYEQASTDVVIIRKPQLRANLSDNPPVTIRGIVTDDKGLPLPGVSVVLKGTSTSTTTNAEGRYGITSPTGSGTLVFSFVGFKTREVTLNGRTEINVTLEENVAALNEVVILGYTSGQKKDLTGSVGIVDVADMQKAPVQSFEEALGGRVAGVQVVSQDGKPGAPVNILIRGLGSITQGSEPLYVIDGLAIENPDNNLLDMANIESFTVLKDASATAIYGARGGNGVIVITTKRGKTGPSKVNYTSYFGVSAPTKYYEVLSPYEFVRLASDQFGAANNPYLSGGRTLEDYRHAAGYDFQDALLRTGVTHNHSLSVSGGRDGTNYSMSGNLVKQSGIVIASDYSRYQGKATLDQKVGEKAKVGGFLTYTRNLTTGGVTSTGARSALFVSAYTYRPIPTPSTAAELGTVEDLLYDPDMTSTTDFRVNPLVNYQNEKRTRLNSNIIGNLYVDYNILKSLKLTLRGSVNSNNERTEAFNNSQTRSGGRLLGNGPNGTLYNRGVNVYDNTNLLAYNTTIDKKHRISALLGTQVQKTDVEQFGYGANGLPDENLGVSGLETGVLQANQARASLSDNTMLSGFTSLNYTFADKYYITTTFRADGSSKFQNNKWGYFPSAALKWKISEEEFFKRQSIVSDANIRVSYGASGNNRVGDFDYMDRLNFSSVLYLNGNRIGANAVTESLPNPDLKWETSVTENIAFDLGFLKNRLTLSVDLYRKKVKDLLYQTFIPGNTGYTSVIKNIASLSNRGLELTLDADIIKKKNFDYSANFNITFNRNRLDELSDPTEEGIMTNVNWESNFTNTPAFISRVGGPLGQIYGYVHEGLYQIEDFDILPSTTGVPVRMLKSHLPTNGPTVARAGMRPGMNKFTDINGDGLINNDDRVVIGNGYPIHVGGLSNNFRYKNFDLNAFFQWSYGNDVINANRVWFEGGGSITFNSSAGPQNAFAAFANRWTETNTNTNIARIGEGSAVYSTQFVEDGSFLRLKTLNLGYRIPAKFLSRYKIQALRLSLAASNLVTFTKYQGYDPEVSTYSSGLSPALDYSSYPRPVTITGGVNLTF